TWPVDNDPPPPEPLTLAGELHGSHGCVLKNGVATPGAATRWPWIVTRYLPGSGMPAGTFPVGLYGKFLAKDGAESASVTRAHNENADTLFKILDPMVPSYVPYCEHAAPTAPFRTGGRSDHPWDAAVKTPHRARKAPARHAPRRVSLRWDLART